MALLVQKYGGTSVGSTERIKKVARRVLQTQQAGHQVVVVVSAMSGATDSLIKLSREVSSQPSEREMDVLLSTGEQTTIALLAMALEAMGARSVSLTGGQAGITTDRAHSKAKIFKISPQLIRSHLEDGAIVIVAGFQGQAPSGEITTLGRGGSDLTAIALAAALSANKCEICTDVDGVFTCDPRIVPDARKLDSLSYEEMLEMASSGSKIMQSRSVEFANKFNVLFEVRSSFNQNKGTMVKAEDSGMEDAVIRGVSVERNQAKVTIEGVPDKTGMAAKIFNALAAAQIIVDVIVQTAPHEGRTDISFTTNMEQLEKAVPVLEAVVRDIGARGVTQAAGVAKLSVVGIGMRTHSGVAAKLFDLLARGGFSIQMISTSEIKIAVILQGDRIDDAARCVHSGFGLQA